MGVYFTSVTHFEVSQNSPTSLNLPNPTYFHAALSYPTCGLPVWIILILLLCGDIHKNPGPVTSRPIDGFLLNARSLKSVNSKRNKLIQFHTAVALKKPSIICITETWLTPDIQNLEILSDSEYSVYRKDRPQRRGGGVLTAIHNSIKSKIREDLNSTNPLHNEILVVEIKLPKLPKIALVNMYRAPDDVDTACPNNLNSCLNKI